MLVDLLIEPARELADARSEQQRVGRADHAIPERYSPQARVDDGLALRVADRASEVPVARVERIDRSIIDIANEQRTTELTPSLRCDRHSPRRHQVVTCHQPLD